MFSGRSGVPFWLANTRGGGTDDIGVVIGDPLPGTAAKVEDLYAQPGLDYWYRLVAHAKKGNRSDPTRPVVIHIGAPAMPAPAVLKLEFATDPFPQVPIQFEQRPPGLAVTVESRAGEQGDWVSLAGPLVGQTQATDTKPPETGRVFYRIVYRASNGATSAASPAAELQRP